MVDAIVLAGGLVREMSSDGASGKGLLEINGKPMVDYVLSALEKSELIDKIVVVIPGERLDRESCGRVSYATFSGGSISSTVLAGLDLLGHSETREILVVSADIPLLSREAIDDFIVRSLESGAEICYPIIPESAVTKRFPGVKRTYARFSDGVFTGGNVGMVSSDILREKLYVFENFFDKRKSPLRLTQMLGLRFILKFLIGKMSVSDVERRISQIFGAKGKAVQTTFSEMGFDVDKPSDLEIATKEMTVKLV